MAALKRMLARAQRSLGWSGVALGVAFAAALLVMLVADLHRREAAAQRQSRTLAMGSQRLLWLELRNLERAMHGIAADASQLLHSVPEQAPVLIGHNIEGVLQRHAELDSIGVLDAHGRALGDGQDDLRLPLWTEPARQGRGSALYLGPPQRQPAGHWVVPLALPMEEGRWLLARLRTDELQQIISGLDIGPQGVVSITDRDGYVLARAPAHGYLVGQRFALPHREQVGRNGVMSLGKETSSIDGAVRISAMSTLEQYPLAVYAGLGRRDVLAPWWSFVYVAIGLLLVYWVVLWVLLHVARRVTRRQFALAEELRAGHAELQLAHQVGRVATWYVDEDARNLHWSALGRDLFNLDVEQMPLAQFMTRVHHDDVDRLRAAFQEAFADDVPLDEAFRLVLTRGDVRWVSARGRRVTVGNNERRVIGALTDVSERHLARERADKVERQFRLLFDRNPAPFWVFDPDTLRFMEVNEAAVEQYGYSRDEFLSMSILDIRPREGWDEIRKAVQDTALGDHPNAAIRLHRRKDGTVFEVRAHLARLDFDGRPACLVLAEDVSQRLAYERELAYHASHHAETGLLNTRALADLLEGCGTGYTVAYIQLRGLQLITDALGRDVGEAVLQAVAARLGGLGARYGWLAFQPSEDFVFAFSDAHDANVALDALVQIVSEPVRGQDSLHQFEPSIGVAVGPADGRLRAEQVIGMAAQAAHSARAEGDVLARFDPTVNARLAERLRLAGRIHTAIESEFQLYFQPICHAADGTPAALEALLRWPQADGSFIAPSEFIQVCEDTGLILALGRWVIRAAARAQRQLVDAGFGDLPIAVNVSAVQFFNSDLVGEFTRAMHDHGLARGALQVELTESSLMRKPAQAMQTMQRLHEHGICVSLDDFGTGFSSMTYLQHLPLDILKIDRSFVADVETNPRNASICRALLSLGHSMGLTIIAEGVETPGQHQWLAAHGCDQVQGYLLGRPAPLQQIIDQLDTVDA